LEQVDVLIIAALKEEFEAAKAAVPDWTSGGSGGVYPFLRGSLECADGRRLSLALARPIRMSGRHAGPIAAELSAQLRPGCLAMPGVCAGNPSAVALGDVVVAEMTYEYDEGRLSEHGFTGDHRQYKLDDQWIRAADDFDPTGLPSWGPASRDESATWLLERLYLGQEPTKHPALPRYVPREMWPSLAETLESEGLVVRDHPSWKLTDLGRRHIERIHYDDVYGPEQLPYAVTVAPMASGSYVAQDGASWARLATAGVRTVAGLDMEAATIATVAAAQRVPWLVAKGVMDYADPAKEDRYKRFAARASAEVLYALLDRLAEPAPDTDSPRAGSATRNTTNAGGVQGIQIGEHNVQQNTFG